MDKKELKDIIKVLKYLANLEKGLPEEAFREYFDTIRIESLTNLLFGLIEILDKKNIIHRKDIDEGIKLWLKSKNEAVMIIKKLEEKDKAVG